MNLTTARDTIDILYGPPLQVISDSLRGFLCAPPDYDFIGCDFEAIEARVIAWLAGQESSLEIFRTHGKIYEYAAAGIYGIDIRSVSKDQRQVGKVAVLALGFQGGVGAFQQMAKGYGVTMAPALPSLWAAADSPTRAKAEKNWEKNKKRYEDISREEYIASDLTKLMWRDTNPAIVKYWWDLESASVAACYNQGQKFSAGVPGRQVTFMSKGSFLFCRLPSGRALCYPYPQIKEIDTPWDTKKDAVTYMTEDSTTGRWIRAKAYGGLLSENVTQAVARDLLTDAMVRLERAGFPIVLHIHDEIVIEVKSSAPAELLSEIEQITSTVPGWAKDLPIGAKGWRDKRFKKD